MAQLGKYVINGSDELGSGGYGAVYKGKHAETGELVAIKVVGTDRMNRKAIINEVKLMEMLDHPNVIKLHECQDRGDRVFIVSLLPHRSTCRRPLSGTAPRCPPPRAPPLLPPSSPAATPIHSRAHARARTPAPDAPRRCR